MPDFPRVTDTKEIADVLTLGKMPIASNSFAPAVLPLTALPLTTRSYGSMVLWRNRFLFILRGNTTNAFWCWDIEKGVVRTLQTPAFNIAHGSLVGVHQDRYLYTCVGLTTTTFIRYDIWTDSWTSVTSLPATITTEGGGSGYDGVEYIYLLRGGGTTTAYRWLIGAPSWETIAATPAAATRPSNIVRAGGFLYVLRGADTNQMFRYSLALGTWVTIVLPVTTNAGALTWDGGKYLYVLRGAGVTDFLRLDLETHMWLTLSPCPATTQWGGLAYYRSPALGDVIFVRRGGPTATTDWWMYRV